jgi:hypothetical protein
MAATTLVAFAAACGSGLTSQQPRFQQKATADLVSENGLAVTGIAITCLSMDVAPAPAVDAPPVDPLLVDPLAPLPDSDPTLVLIEPDPTSCGDVMNGLPPNLLGLKGLHANGLKEKQFQKWFAKDSQSANILMKYMVRCSLPLGETLTYTAPDGAAWSWPGNLGLAPEWASGKSIPESEQQLVSACIAAHANKYGAHVPISVLGRRADGTELPMGDDELSDYPISEGCFFGNLFHKGGTYSGDDRTMSLTDAQSSLRACAMPERPGDTASCAPMVFVGSCRDFCQPDPRGLYYTSCKVNGKSYRPITTRIQPSVQFTCGDGVCQRTEKCGTGSTWDNCGLDCGPCN